MRRSYSIGKHDLFEQREHPFSGPMQAVPWNPPEPEGAVSVEAGCTEREHSGAHLHNSRTVESLLHEGLRLYGDRCCQVGHVHREDHSRRTERLHLLGCE